MHNTRTIVVKISALAPLCPAFGEESYSAEGNQLIVVGSIGDVGSLDNVTDSIGAIDGVYLGGGCESCEYGGRFQFTFPADTIVQVDFDVKE